MSGSWSLPAIIRGDELDPPARWIVDHGVHSVAPPHLLDTDVATPVGVLSAILVLTLVLAGEDDHVRLTAPSLGKALGDGRFRAVPGVHLAAMSAPELAAEMAEFLTP